MSALVKHFSRPLPREHILYLLVILLLPIQLGKHFWFDFSIVGGLRVDYLSPTLFVTDILLGILFLHWCIRMKSLKNLFVFTWIIFFLFLIVRSLLSTYPLLSLYGVMKVFEMVFLGFYTASYLRTVKQWKVFSFVFSVSLFAQGLLGIVQYLRQSSLDGVLYWVGERTFSSVTPGIANATINGELVLRPYGTFPHPNVFAAYLLSGMVLLLCCFQLVSPKKKVWFMLCLLSAFVALFLTMSRAAMLAAIFSLCMGTARVYKKKLLFPIVFFSVIGGVSVALPFPILSRFFHFSFSEESVVVREYLLLATLAMIKHSPFFGVGLGHFLHHLPVSYTVGSLFTAVQPVHNTFLLLVAQLGIVGMLFALYFLWQTVRVVRKTKQQQLLKITLLFVFLFTGLFDHYWFTLQQGQLLTAIILGMCWAPLRKTTH